MIVLAGLSAQLLFVPIKLHMCDVEFMTSFVYLLIDRLCLTSTSVTYHLSLQKFERIRKEIILIISPCEKRHLHSTGLLIDLRCCVMWLREKKIMSFYFLNVPIMFRKRMSYFITIQKEKSNPFTKLILNEPTNS